MAKSTTSAPSNVTNLPSKPKPPEGLSRVASDVSAFWDPSTGSPVYGVLAGAKDTRNKRGQIVRIYMFELLAECTVKVRRDGELVTTTARAGEVVGVWGTAGLSELDQLGGCKVWIFREGKKDIGNGQTMWSYDIQSAGQGKPLRVRQVKDAPTPSEDDQIEF